MKLVFMILCLSLCCTGLWADTVPLPSNDFNEYVIGVLKTYPTDGTHQYYWPSGESWSGNTRDLYYRSELFAQGDTLQRCYCCGLTFEVFFRAYERYCQDRGWPFIIADFDVKALRTFKSQWFGSDGNTTTLQNAIVKNDIGRAIEMSQACVGDFVQFWRHSGSGHSVIFISWVYDDAHNISGLQYWSTQRSTNGIGYATEYFGATQGLDITRVHIARVGK